MPAYLEFEVSLREIKPRIWRRFLLPQAATFQNLHDAIQAAAGWEDYHLWEFRGWGRTGTTLASPAGERDGWTDEPLPDARKTRLADHFATKGDRCLYTYDFGDTWEHEVKLRNVVELPEKFKRRLIAGARAFPPEDCGGTLGYYVCLAAVGALDPRELGDYPAEELAERQEWLGDWTPDFDLEAARRDFDR